MVFTFEALQAAHGDALLLHYGPADSLRLAVIDGGPLGIYKKSVKPRLEEIRARRTPDDTLPLDYVIVSHIDDDHIHGITDLTRELVEALQSPQTNPYAIKSLWHNAFENVVGDDKVADVAKPAVAASLASIGDPLVALRNGIEPSDMSLETALVLASVDQGSRLRDDARRLNCVVNDGKTLLVAPLELEMGNGLKATIVGPLKGQLDALQQEWEKNVKQKQHASPKDKAAAVAAYVDQSVPNLSSIVILAELDGQQILLTGDARGDYILQGLEAADALDNGKLHLDVLKVPHHGSERDVEKDFFERITADRYVISANGKYDNPDLATLEMIAAARGADEFTIHVTNHDGQNNLRAILDGFIAKAKAAGQRFQVEFPEPGHPIKIELGDPLGF